MEKHSGDTDKAKKVTLTSSIEHVLWTKNNGAPGGKIGLEIITHLVGSNSDISIQISDKLGKTFDTIKKKLFGNKFYVEVTIPENAKDQLFAEVKLSKLGLTKKSEALNLFPLIEIKNLKWDRDEVHRGDVVKITADISGIYNGAEAEVQIWEYDSDLAHDFVASIPVTTKNTKIETLWEFQYVEDTDDIPTQEETESGYQWPKYFFRVIVGGKSEDSKIMKFKDWIEIKWLYPNGQPAANKEFKLFLADGKKRNETFNENGEFRLEDMPPGPFKIILEDE